MSKRIGINEPIPLKVLEKVFLKYLETKEVDRDYIEALLSEYIEGDNRRNKAVGYTNVIFTRPAILHDIFKTWTSDRYLTLPEQERKVLLVQLCSLAYPIFFDVINTVGSVFKIQSKVNQDVVITRLASTYGSNRTLYNAVKAILPMLIEANYFVKPKAALYEFTDKINIKSPFLMDFIIYTGIKLSSTKTVLAEDIPFKNWMYFFDFADEPDVSKSELVSVTDGMLGGGYLSVT